MDETQPEVKPETSPTGRAMVAMPPWVMAALVVVSASCAAAAMVDGLLTPHQEKLATFIGIIAATLLGTTPGLRKGGA